MEHPNVSVDLRRPNIGREIVLAFCTTVNLNDIPYQSDSRETLNRVHVKHVRSKGAIMSKTVATFVQNVGLIWLKGGFYFIYSGHKCNCWLKIVTHWDKHDNGVM